MAGESVQRGADGESAIARVLRQLPSAQWRVFHHVGWPGRQFASIDHVLVGPQGVFVVDTKAWNGEVVVRSGTLRQNGHRRTEAVAGATIAAEAVSEIVPGLDADAVKPVLCMVRPQPVFGWAEEVMVCSTANIVTLLTSRPKVLNEAAVSKTAELLAGSLRAASSPVAQMAPKTRRRPRRRSPLLRSLRSGSLRSGPAKSVAGVAACALLVLVVLQLDVPGRVGALGANAVQRMNSPVKPAGQMFTVTGDATRPTLDFTAEQPTLTRSKTPGVRLKGGHRLVAVPMSIHNAGDHTWVSGTSVRLYDAARAAYPIDSRFTRVAAGRVLPRVVRLRPGSTSKGFMVFDVPRRTTITEITLAVGPDSPTTVRWSVGR
jgi:hypothetical protein